jgi:hypothetical protein
LGLIPLGDDDADPLSDFDSHSALVLASRMELILVSIGGGRVWVRGRALTGEEDNVAREVPGLEEEEGCLRRVGRREDKGVDSPGVAVRRGVEDAAGVDALEDPPDFDVATTVRSLANSASPSLLLTHSSSPCALCVSSSPARDTIDARRADSSLACRFATVDCDFRLAKSTPVVEVSYES